MIFPQKVLIWKKINLAEVEPDFTSKRCKVDVLQLLEGRSEKI
jgi:hypothetical protein